MANTNEFKPADEHRLVTEVDPRYRKMQLVPAFVVQPAVSWVLAAVGLIGGAILGVGLGAFATPTTDSAIVQALAKACVEKETVCQGLAVQGSGPGAGWAFIGLFLCIVYCAGLWRISNAPDAPGAPKAPKDTGA